MSESSMDAAESTVLEFLDNVLREDGVRHALDEIVERLEHKLTHDEEAMMAWESVPLDVYGVDLPGSIGSSWVFDLRASTATGAERHPNSRQRMMSYRGTGDLQTKTSLKHEWSSHRLECSCDLLMQQRWISIPPNVWHQALVPESDWFVVSFHSVPSGELIEERPDPNEDAATHMRRYADMDGSSRGNK